MRIVIEGFNFVRLNIHPDSEQEGICRGSGRLSIVDMGKTAVTREPFARCPDCREYVYGKEVVKRRPWIWF